MVVRVCHIEVWSVSEGQQRFDTHVDKLMNYIRYWQASGESIKTSIRVKTRLSQLVQEGCYRGGTPPYGYRLEKLGHLNKKNREVYDLVIDEAESVVAKTIFDLYLTRGYGSHRIGTYLMEHGVMNRKGNNFTNTTIQHMLKNISYTGIMRSGETITDVFPHLQIIDVDTFEQVQQIIRQRSRDYEERRVPLNTKGSSLLSGNVFSGHYGARLTVTTNGKKYHRKDGEVTVTPRTRYVCYNKTRHPQKCDGQTGYTVRKLDELIENIVRDLFSRLSDIPKDKMIEGQYAAQRSTLEKELKAAKSAQRGAAAELVEIEAEVLKVIRKESELNADLINQLYEQAKAKMEQAEKSVKLLEKALSSSESAKNDLLMQYDSFKSWAEMFDSCDTETKKMIFSRIISAVRVKRDYDLEIDFTVDCKALGLLSNDQATDDSPSLRSA